MSTYRQIGLLLGCALGSAQAVGFSPFGPPPTHRAWAPATPGQRPPAYAYYRAPAAWPPALYPDRRRAYRAPPTAVPEAASAGNGPATGGTRGGDDPPAAASIAPPASTLDVAAPGPDGDRAAFIERLLPLVTAENIRLGKLREEVAKLVRSLDAGKPLADGDAAKLQRLARRYRVDGDPLSDAAARDALLDRIDTIPISLALAQAANESAWGTSRFAREGNNLFGIWTYDESKGIVPRRRETGKTHLVRKFDSERESVRYYMFTLNSHPAYAELRLIRAQRREQGLPVDGAALAQGLTAYSAKGEEYVRLIRGMIRRLDLATFDTGERRGA